MLSKLGSAFCGDGKSGDVGESTDALRVVKKLGGDQLLVVAVAKEQKGLACNVTYSSLEGSSW